MVLITPLESSEIKSELSHSAQTTIGSHFIFKSMLLDTRGDMGEVLNNIVRTGTLTLLPDGHATASKHWDSVIDFVNANSSTVDLQVINPLKWYHKGQLVRTQRDHRRIGIVEFADNRSPELYIAGLNWEGFAFKTLDFGAKITNAPDLYETIVKTTLEDISESKIIKNLDENRFNVVADEGLISKSINREKFIGTIDSVRGGQEVILISQYPPDGRVAKAIYRAAQRKSYVTIITNSNENQSTPTRLAMKLVESLSISRRILEDVGVKFITPKIYVHGKGLLIKDSSVMWGSYNFTDFTSWLGGMKEVSLFSSHPDVLEAMQPLISDIRNRYQ